MFGTLGRMLGGMFGVGDEAGRRVAGAVGAPVSGSMPVGGGVPMQPGDGSMLQAPGPEAFRPMPGPMAAAQGYGPPPMMQPPSPLIPRGPGVPNGRPVSGLSMRPQQTLGGMLWPGYGWGGWGEVQAPRQIESQLPMGRTSPTGSSPFMQDGRGWGGRV